MGIPASGATLEIQLVADVARLQRDMKSMQATIDSAAAGAGKSFAGLAATSTNSATRMAASAQATARAAVGMAAGVKTAGAASGLAAYQVQNLAFQVNDMVTGVLSGQNPLRIMAQQSGQVAQIMQQSGLGARGFARALLELTGIITITRDAELAEAAAQKAAAAEAVRSRAARAASTLEARNAEVALAQAQLAAAETADAEALAQARLAKALRSVELAAGRAAIANQALAGAEAEAAAASEASAAKTAVALSARGAAIAGVLGGAAIAGGFLIAVFKDLQAQVRDSGALDRYANSLGLTKKEMKELRQEVGGLSSKEMKDLDARARAFEITWGDVFNGLKKTADDALDLSPAWQKFTSGARNAFEAFLQMLVPTAAALYGHFVGAYRTVVQTFSGLPAALGSAFLSAVNAAIREINKLIKASVDGVNGFIDQANKLPLVDLAHLSAPQISEIQNSYAIAGKGAGKSFADNVAEATAEAQGKMSQNVAVIMDNILGAAEERIRKAAETIIEDRTPQKAKKQSDHGLANALAELDAQIRGQWRLAAAYQVSDAAAMKAEALQRAEEQAIRHKGEVGIFYEKELAKAIATRAADGAKTIADLRAETAARKKVNDMVATGVIPANQANQALDVEQKLRALNAAFEAASAEDKQKLLPIIEALRGAQADLNKELAREIALKESASKDDEVARLKLETELIGASNRERAVRLAQLEAEQFIKNNKIAPEDQAGLVRRYVDAAVAATNLQTAQDNYNSSLAYTGELFGLINDQAGELSNILSSAFGGFGDSVGGAINALASLQEREQAIADWKRDEAKKAGGDAARLSQIEILAARKSATARMAATGDVISSMKGLFKQHSTGYKVMTAIEKAYAIFQAVQTVAAIARDMARTTSSVANSAVRTTANTAEGASKIFAELGPWAFPVVAAMVAVLAALGAKGGGGGAGRPSIPSAEDAQAAQGAGTVLGDAAAKSESIKNALEIVAANTNKDLEYSNAMLRALRNIDLSIAKMAGTVARQIQVSGSLFDTSKLKLGTSGSSGFLGIGASQTTRNLYDLGLILNSASVSDIIANGIGGQTYQIVEKIKKKSGFLGIGGGTKTTYKTTNGAIDSEITDAIQAVILSLRDGLVAAADVIGLEGAQAILDSFQVSIGKISFKDMTGQEIEEQLNAIFSKVGDQMAAKLLPSLEQMQLVGEGLFETFIRVAKEYEAVDIALKSIGRTFGMIGVESIAARDHLVQLFGGLEDFIESTDFFRDQFLSDVEQIAPIQAAVIAELQRLGVAGITTRDQFKQAVLGLDLTTAAGREMYAALLAVAPAFDKVLDYFDELNKKTIQSLQQTIDQFGKFAESLRKYRDTLFATDAAQGNAYAALRAKFVATAGLAATGDATALGGLETAGKDFLTSAKANASTWLQYQRDVALVARGVDQGIFAAEETADYAQLQLQALQNATSILQAISYSTAATAAALASDVTAAQQAAAGSPVPAPSVAAVIASSPAPLSAGATTPAGAAIVADSEVRAEVAGLKSEVATASADIKAALEAIAVNTGSADRQLKRWDDGDALAITARDAVDVNLASWGGPGADS